MLHVRGHGHYPLVPSRAPRSRHCPCRSPDGSSCLSQSTPAKRPSAAAEEDGLDLPATSAQPGSPVSTHSRAYQLITTSGGDPGAATELSALRARAERHAGRGGETGLFGRTVSAWFAEKEHLGRHDGPPLRRTHAGRRLVMLALGLAIRSDKLLGDDSTAPPTHEAWQGPRPARAGQRRPARADRLARAGLRNALYNRGSVDCATSGTRRPRGRNVAAARRPGLPARADHVHRAEIRSPGQACSSSSATDRRGGALAILERLVGCCPVLRHRRRLAGRADRSSGSCSARSPARTPAVEHARCSTSR